MAEFVLDPVEKAGARVRIQNIRFVGRGLPPENARDLK
jgi:hypothetical protein